MKQKLSIAIAILENSEFLIIYELINGLDSVVIVDIRALLKN